MVGADEDPRASALAWAAHLRDVRSRVRGALETGATDLAEVLSRRDDPAVGRIHLLSVLESLPGARKVTTRRALASMDVVGRTPLGALTDAEVDGVLERFGRHATGSAP